MRERCWARLQCPCHGHKTPLKWAVDSVDAIRSIGLDRIGLNAAIRVPASGRACRLLGRSIDRLKTASPQRSTHTAERRSLPSSKRCGCIPACMHWRPFRSRSIQPSINASIDRRNRLIPPFPLASTQAQAERSSRASIGCCLLLNGRAPPCLLHSAPRLLRDRIGRSTQVITRK